MAGMMVGAWMRGRYRPFPCAKGHLLNAFHRLAGVCRFPLCTDELSDGDLNQTRKWALHLLLQLL